MTEAHGYEQLAYIELLLDSGLTLTGNRTHDRLIASRRPNHYATKLYLNFIFKYENCSAEVDNK